MPQSSIIVGDCRQVLQLFPDDHFDSIVTDPPYGLKFMGKAWDHSVPGVAFWSEFLRVAKPGAYLLAFGGSRTHHRIACAVEDAGWQIRDTIMWLYGSGFPKGDNLKPAHEPIVLARKPGKSSGLNIDACRVGSEVRHATPTSLAPCSGNKLGHPDGWGTRNRLETRQYVGRYPANVIHDGGDEVLAAFPDAPGQIAAASTSDTQRAGQNVYGAMRRGNAARGTRPGGFGDVGADEPESAPNGPLYNDKGSAARFFYCAKASKADRGEGNTHPTVKPEMLMRYLCRLVTPPGGMILDPFGGSGSTGKAASLEGFDSTLIELEDDHAVIARGRV